MRDTEHSAYELQLTGDPRAAPESISNSQLLAWLCLSSLRNDALGLTMRARVPPRRTR